MRRLALVVALILLLAFAAHKQQTAPITVVCGQVSGGQTMTARGVGWAQKAGGWIRNVADRPEEYRNPETIRDTLAGMFRGVLWYWIKSGVQSARGEKIDPQILRLQAETAEAVRNAQASCCPTTPPPLPHPEDDWTPDMAAASLGRFSDETGRIARAAILEVRRAGMPERAAVVMLAAGFVESGVRSLPYGDRDSVGWLQQRDAWGPRADRMNPAKAARMFLEGGQGGQPGLKDKRWQQMSVGQAAQAVQVSAFPDRYAAFEDDARRLIAAVGGFGPKPESNPEAPGYTAGDCTPVGETSSGSAAAALTVAPAGWDFPGQRTVDQAIAWMRAQDRRDARGWQARCLAAVGQAYGHPGTTQVNGRFWAIDQWTAMPARFKTPGKANPPRGALVFWDTRPYGHIAISNGDGRVWTTDPPGRTGQIGLVPLSSIDAWGTRLGHGAPHFIGKTGANA